MKTITYQHSQPQWLCYCGLLAGIRKGHGLQRLFFFSGREVATNVDVGQLADADALVALNW